MSTNKPSTQQHLRSTHSKTEPGSDDVTARPKKKRDCRASVQNRVTKVLERN